MVVEDQQKSKIRRLTRDEAWALFDEEVQAYLGFGAGEFVRRYEAGELDTDNPDVAFLLAVWDFAA